MHDTGFFVLENSFVDRWPSFVGSKLSIVKLRLFTELYFPHFILPIIYFPFPTSNFLSFFVQALD